MKSPLSPQTLQIVANIFKALSEPSRLKIIQDLQGGEKSVTALAQTTQCSQPNVSKHLKILSNAKLVEKRQEGNTVFYFIEDSMIYQLCDLVCGSIQERIQHQMQILKDFPKSKKSKRAL